MFSPATPSAVASSSRVTLNSATPNTTPIRASTMSTPGRRSDWTRTPSYHSDGIFSNGRNRNWSPATPSFPLSSIEGKEGKGELMGKTNLGDAERGLSSLFVDNERKVGTKEGIGVKKRKKTWGGSLIDGAMNATVLGAALGLTAYRMLTGEERSQSLVTEEPTPSSPPRTAGSVRSRPDSVEFPPPPAYSETLHNSSRARSTAASVDTMEQGDDDEDLWVDIHNKPLSSLHYVRSTNQSPLKSPRRSKHRSRGSKSRPRKVTAMERKITDTTAGNVRKGLTFDEDPFVCILPSPSDRQDTEQRRSDSLSRNLATVKQGVECTDVDNDCMDPLEVIRRLDELVETLKKMIHDGTRALAEPCPDLSTGIWVDRPTRPIPSERRQSHSKTTSADLRKPSASRTSPSSRKDVTKG